MLRRLLPLYHPRRRPRARCRYGYPHDHPRCPRARPDPRTARPIHLVGSHTYPAINPNRRNDSRAVAAGFARSTSLNG